MTNTDLLGLQGFQLALNVALVGRTSLDALPLVDELLSLQCEGERLRCVREGDSIWQNLGPRHSLQLATPHGFDSLAGARDFFEGQLSDLAREADRVEGRLMPGGMHPWFRAASVQTWPHGGAVADESMHALFGTARHGWANQQALTLVLPFASEAEFAPLYAALRFLLPLMPALSAASPIAEGAIGPARQCRVGARHDLLCSRPAFALTSVQRHVPPALEALGAFASLVTEPLDAALRSHGVAKSLTAADVSASGLWVDGKAGTIEIRMLDGQESLQSNIAVCQAIFVLSRHLCFDSQVPSAELDVWPAARLSEMMQATVEDGEAAILRDADYLRTWGFPEGSRCRTSELVQYLWEEKLFPAFDEASRPAMETIALRGPLASRIIAALPPRWDDESIFNVYRKVANCLANDTIF